MHVGKLLARLNPTTAGLGVVGSGGVPELTPQDIAAALAFVPRGLGRELLCRIWWPEGAALSPKELDRLLMEAQLTEWRRRVDAIVMAQLRRAYAETDQQLARANAALDAAKAIAWPRLGPESCYAAVRRAVLIEMSAGSLCPSCGGRGSLQNVHGQVVSCGACLGAGRRRSSDRARADLIERDEATYRRAWKPVYEWTEGFCLDSISPAESSLRGAISN